MKAISNLQVTILTSMLLIGSQLAGQSLLPAGPIVIETECQPETAIIENYTLLAEPDTFVLNNFSILSYQWKGPVGTKPAMDDAYVANKTGAYVLTVEALRLRDSVKVQLSDSIQVIFDAQCCKIRMPNAFTPNGDNKNDVFAPVLPQHCVFQDYQLQVFNRWGKKVFDTELMNTPVTPDTVLGWDGKIDGKDAPSDVYVYWLRYTATGNDDTFTPNTKRGNVTLIR